MAETEKPKSKSEKKAAGKDTGSGGSFIQTPKMALSKTLPSKKTLEDEVEDESDSESEEEEGPVEMLTDPAQLLEMMRQEAEENQDNTMEWCSGGQPAGNGGGDSGLAAESLPTQKTCQSKKEKRRNMNSNFNTPTFKDNIEAADVNSPADPGIATSSPTDMITLSKEQVGEMVRKYAMEALEKKTIF